MMRFTFGVAILIFTIIMGGYQYFSNKDTIMLTENSLANIEQKYQRSTRVQTRLADIKNSAIPRGQDQKNTIERILELDRLNATFTFLGKPTLAGGSATVYRYNYRIQGSMTYANSYKLIQKLNNHPGFSVFKVCYGCQRRPRDLPETQHMVQIEGYLYVYDPDAI